MIPLNNFSGRKPLNKNRLPYKYLWFIPGFRIHKKRLLWQEDTGQLIAMMGVILAISVFFLASLSTELIGLDVAVPQQRSTSPLLEFLHIKEAFGLALQYNLGNMTVNETGNRLIFLERLVFSNVSGNAFTKTTREFKQLLLAHNIHFNTQGGSVRFQSLTDNNGYIYQCSVTLEYYDGSTYIKQQVLYSLIGRE